MAIERVAGERPNGCPWAAFANPIVRDVLELYRSCGTGDGVQIAVMRLTNPPHHLWEGLQWYAHSAAKCREDAVFQRREKEKRKRDGRSL